MYFKKNKHKNLRGYIQLVAPTLLVSTWARILDVLMENSPLYSSKHDAARSTDTGKDQPGTWAALGHGLPSGKRGLDSQGNELKPSL